MMLLAPLPIGISGSDWLAVLPELIMGAGVLVLMLLDAFVKRRQIEVTTGVAALTLVAAFASSLYLWNHGTAFAMHDTVTSDKFAMFFNYVILLAALLAILLSPSYIRFTRFDAGEYYALVMASAAGMMLMAAGTNFMILFLAIELLSLSLYILSGFSVSSERSQEAGFKYFLLSSFASAFLLYGMALIYGATGTTSLRFISACLQGYPCAAGAPNSPLLLAGIALMVVGFAFKVSVVPFHMWTPDVYQGAPTPITAFMSAATKASVFAAIVRVFDVSLTAVQNHWFDVLWGLAVLTMIVGNVIAIAQRSMKRLLAYSGVAHAGYVLVAVLANSASGMSAVAFYFLSYTFMNIGAFVLVSVLESRGEVGDEISSYRGLWYRNPWLAGATAVFMFSLAGFPPTAGFFAKYLAFVAIVRAGHTELAIIGVLTSLISIFYYLRVVWVMFMQPAEVPEGQREIVIPAGADIALALAVAGTLGLGILPTGFFNLATQSADALRGVFGLGP